MRIGIDIDQVLRNFLGKFAEVYEKEMGKEPILPVVNEDLLTHFPFDGGREEWNHFVYNEYVLELFGNSKELTKDAIHNTNKLAEKLKSMGHELILVSKQYAKSKSATLFFLSKYACQVDQIIFVQDSTKKFDYVDIMVDDSSTVLNSKPIGKISIKFNQEYNKDTVADFSINDIKELLDDDFLNKILSHNYVEFQIVK